MASDQRGDKSIYVPIDLRRKKPEQSPFVFIMNEDEEPACIVLEIFSKQAHVEIKLDEAALDNLFDPILKHRIQLTERLAFQRGAASALRRKK